MVGIRHCGFSLHVLIKRFFLTELILSNIMVTYQKIKADGEVFEFLPETAIKPEYLKVFDFSESSQQISLAYPEFSAVCPFSGLPDIGTLYLYYFPDGGKCLELKALKYYLTSFRPVGIYQEAATARIYNDIKAVLKTERLRVLLQYNTRGGMNVTTEQGSIFPAASITIGNVPLTGNNFSGISSITVEK